MLVVHPFAEVGGFVKMAISGAECAFCVLEFDKKKSATDVQHKFPTKYDKEAQSRKVMYAWYNKFVHDAGSDVLEIWITV